MAKPLNNGATIYWSWESNTQATPSMGKFTHTQNGPGGAIDTLNVSKWDYANSSQSMHDAFLRTLDDGGSGPVCYATISDPNSATGYQTFLVTALTEFTNHFRFNVQYIAGSATWWGPPLNRPIEIGFLPLRGGVSVDQNTGTTLWNTNGFRLGLTNNVPDDTASQVAKSVLYWTPYISDAIALYDGTKWNIRNVSQRSLTLSGLTANKNYDVFVYDNAGVPTLELGPAWTSNTVRATNIVRLNGVFVKSGTPTRRYLGSIRTTSANTTESSDSKRYVYNYDNPLPMSMYGVGSIIHSYNSTAVRLWGNSVADAQSEVLVGVGNQRILEGTAGSYGYSGSGGDARILVCLDTSPTSFLLEAESTLVQSSTATWVWVEASRKRLPQGLNYVQLCQRVFSGSNLYGWYVRNFTFSM